MAQDNTLPASGNVGIGTLNPTTRLDVNGNMKIDSCLHIKDTLVVEDDARIMNDLKVEGETKLENVTVIGEFKLPNIHYDSTITKIMALDSNFNAREISLYDLGQKLIGPIYDHPLPQDPQSICDKIGYTDAPVWHNGIKKIYSDCPEVNVGIATTTPRVNLDVNGRAFAQRMFLGIADPTTNEPGIFVLKSNNSTIDRPLFVIENEDRKIFQVNNHGLVRAREIRIDALIWADFVFRPDYSLRPLREVESYIQAHGHLPDVPSEAEVIENGLDVAQMQAVLLQKIEELTLYSIEQEKRIAELEEKLNTIINDK